MSTCISHVFTVYSVESVECSGELLASSPAAAIDTMNMLFGQERKVENSYKEIVNFQ